MNDRIYCQQIDEYLKKIDLEFLQGKSVLVTGATGMIGSALVDLLLRNNELNEEKIHIYAVGRNIEKAANRFNKRWNSKSFTFIQHDVIDEFPNNISCDYIIHAASNAYPRMFAIDPVGTMTANFIGMYNILNLGKEKRVKKVLYVSSGEIYGDVPKDEKRECDYGYVDCMNVRSCYPLSKRAAETLCVAFTKQYGIDTVIVRPSHVYGPTMLESDNRAVSSFIRAAALGHDLIMHSEGNVVRSYTYVLDVCSALIMVLAKGRSLEAYNIASKDVISIKDLAELIATLGKIKIVKDYSEVKDYAKLGFTTITRQVLNSDKLCSLGWRAQIDIVEGIKSTLNIIS